MCATEQQTIWAAAAPPPLHGGAAAVAAAPLLGTGIISPETVTAIGVNQMNGAAVQDVTNGANVLRTTVTSIGGRAANGLETDVGRIAKSAASLEGVLSKGTEWLNGLLNI